MVNQGLPLSFDKAQTIKTVIERLFIRSSTRLFPVVKFNKSLGFPFNTLDWLTKQTS